MDVVEPRSRLPALCIAVALAVVAFVQTAVVFEFERAASSLSPEGAQAGFPLDDTWIHLVYARSLANELIPAYNPGEAEAGQSSLVWGLLLAVVHRVADAFEVPIAHAVRSFGVCVWIALALLCAATVLKLRVPGAAFGAIGVAALIGLDPLLAFTAASGMEPLLAALFVVACAHALIDGHTIRAGFWCGLAIWARPELAPLAGLAALCAWRYVARFAANIAVSPGSPPAGASDATDASASIAPSPHEASAPSATARSPMQAALEVLLPTVMLALVWVVLCLGITGRPLPNTWYAKAETFGFVEGAVRGVVGLARLWADGPWFHSPTGWLLPAIGVATLWFRASRAAALFVLLAPFLFAAAIGATRELPTQDAFYWQRYLVPVLPLLHLWTAAGIGVAGSLIGDVVRAKPTGPSTLPAPIVALLLVALVGVAFMKVGAALEGSRDRFARDVRDVDALDVGAAKWLASQHATKTLTSVGAMDAGAVRYFMPPECRVVDLIGLNDAELIGRAIAEEDLGPYLQGRRMDAMLLLEPDPGSVPFVGFAQRSNMARLHERLAHEYGVLGQIAPKSMTVWMRRP
ncbi:MAG: hypothetical protein IPH13_11400 [Planctomycetes bacterium]|nr:hypothetical protein [Planctomycetota bacterium]MCC7172942.1 hypothetical protein [Planctomycetota bacterium]